MNRLEELKKAMDDANALYRAAEEKLKRTIYDETEAAKKRIRDSHEAEQNAVTALSSASWNAKRAYQNALIEDKQESGITLDNGTELRPGDKVERGFEVWPRYGRRSHIDVKQGIVEVRSHETVYLERGNRQPEIGQMFVRLLRKDGKPGQVVHAIHKRDDWKKV